MYIIQHSLFYSFSHCSFTYFSWNYSRQCQQKISKEEGIEVFSCLFSVNNELFPVSLSLISQWRVLTGWLAPLYYKLLTVFSGMVWVKSAKKKWSVSSWETSYRLRRMGTKTIWKKCSRNLFLKPSSVFSRKDIFNDCESNFFIAYFWKLFD